MGTWSLSRGQSDRGVELNTHLQILLRFKREWSYTST